MMTTYSVNIQPDRTTVSDEAIAKYLNDHPGADVEDALDHIFQLGVDSLLSKFKPENQTAPCEVCL